MAERIVKAIAALVLAATLAYALVVATYEAQSQTEPLPVSPYDERLSDLERRALDRAYRRNVERLYDSWMRDATGQPGRALTGIRQSRRAYIEAMTAIDARK